MAFAWTRQQAHEAEQAAFHQAQTRLTGLARREMSGAERNPATRVHAILAARGWDARPAVRDDAGRCRTCGEAERCIGVHILVIGEPSPTSPRTQQDA